MHQGSGRPVVVMGVSGCGKSTVGLALAQAFGVDFVEGDKLHPPENVARMAAGVPLTDQHRHGWLAALAQQLQSEPARTRGVVASCSALKRVYRDQLRAAVPDILFVFLHGDPALLMSRLSARAGHFMPASLLQSQLDILEPPGTDESAFSFNIEQSPDHILRQVCEALEKELH